MSEHFITHDQIIKRVVKKTVRIELLHCPFCGGEADFSRYEKGWSKPSVQFGVVCKDCCARTPIRSGSEAQIRAAEQWNKRAQA